MALLVKDQGQVAHVFKPKSVEFKEFADGHGFTGAVRPQGVFINYE
jgi:hypothetical protein